MNALRSCLLLASLLRRFTLRYWLRHWVKLILLTGVTALGSGAFLAIGLANRAAVRSFDDFAQTLSGPSQIVLSARVGGLALDDLRRIRRTTLDSEATLVPQMLASLTYRSEGGPGNTPTYFTAIGLDLMAASNFLWREAAERTFWDIDTEEETGREGAPDGFYSSPAAAARHGWSPGEAVPFVVDDQILTLSWLGALPSVEAAGAASDRVIVLDWKQLAREANRPERFDRVDLILPEGERTPSGIASAIAMLEAANSDGSWLIESQAQRQQVGATMTQALRMNLRALASLSLLVALCLVFQAMDSAVARRQGEVAVLHSLGLPRSFTRLLWLMDALLIGALGGGGGLVLGYLMSRGSTTMVTQTVNTLYYQSAAPTLSFETNEALLAWGLAVALCMAAGWWPARQAARSPLVESMRQGSRRPSYSRRAYQVAILLCAALAIGAFLLPPLALAEGRFIPVGGYALSIALIGIAAALACLALEGLGALSRPASKISASLSLALSQFRLPVARHRLALCGVTLSVGMTAAMIFLIGSFEATVRGWIGSVLQADLFIRSKAASSMHDDARISPLAATELLAHPEAIDSGSVHSSRIRLGDASVQLVGYDTDYLARVDHTQWLGRAPDLSELKNDATAIVNEAFAHRYRLAQGERFNLDLGRRSETLRVIGIFADYGADAGSIGVDQARYFELTEDRRPRAIALHARDGADLAALASSIAAEYPGLEVTTNRWLREETLRTFKRVFAITYALEVIGLVISVAGLGTMLASLLIERRSELGALRRMGCSPRQMALSCLWEGLGLATLGSIAGLALGGALGLVLVFIVNKQSFGWTLQVSIPWINIATLGILVMAGSAIVAYLVGRWSARLPLINEE